VKGGHFSGIAVYDSPYGGFADTTPGVLAQLAALHSPRDIQEAYRKFGATCGPCAFAALIEKEVAEVIHLFPQFPEKQHTNLPSMKSALRAQGFRFHCTDGFPSFGLTLISGPERYYSRHWIAVRQGCVYDVNLDMWMPTVLWCRDVLPAIARADRWANERWYIVRTLAVEIPYQNGGLTPTPQFDWFL
jgi:hypothetical protein